MSRHDLVILGAGGGSRELLALIRHAEAQGGGPSWKILGILDDDAALVGTAIDNVPILGLLEDAGKFAGARFISGIANVRNPRIRLDVAKRLALAPDRWATFIHPQAVIVDNASVGPGTIVYPNSVVSANARAGAHCVLYYGAVVHHDTVIGDGCCLCASVLIGGGVSVAEGCYLGIGSVVRDHVSVGENTVVGMGALVVRSVGPGQTVTGVPARPRESSSASGEDRRR